MFRFWILCSIILLFCVLSFYNKIIKTINSHFSSISCERTLHSLGGRDRGNQTEVKTDVVELPWGWKQISQDFVRVWKKWFGNEVAATAGTSGECRTGGDGMNLCSHHWLKWFCEAGGGAHPTKPGWSKPHTHSNPTNLALFRRKIALYRFNQGGWGSKGSRGLPPPPDSPPHFNDWSPCCSLI